jgi:hypothetical protein
MSTLISCGYLNVIQKMADDIWNDPMKNNDLIADVVSARAVLENQTINLREVTSSKKNKEMMIEWLTKCSVDTTDCTDDCTISGTDADPQCEVYDITCLQETSFKVPLRAYRERTIEMQQSIAFNKLVHMKALDEWIAQYIITGILSCAGVNQFEGGVGTVADTITYIPPQYWDDNIWGYFNQVARLNKFRNPYLLTGNNLYQLLFNRPLEAGNADGVGNFRKMNSLRVYQDPENIEAVAEGQSFLLHKSAVAFVSKAWNPLNAANAVNLAGNYWEWSEPSMNIPGVVYDIIMTETCEGDEFYQAVKIKLNGLFACNPYPCDEDNTGTLVFECGTGAQ